MTREERDIEALPPKLQRRMALLCLAGWRFEYNHHKFANPIKFKFGHEWMAAIAKARGPQPVVLNTGTGTVLLR